MWKLHLLPIIIQEEVMTNVKKLLCIIASIVAGGARSVSMGNRRWASLRSGPGSCSITGDRNRTEIIIPVTEKEEADFIISTLHHEMRRLFFGGMIG